MMIPKNRDNSGTALLYIVGSVFVRPCVRRANPQVAQDSTTILRATQRKPVAAPPPHLLVPPHPSEAAPQTVQAPPR